MPETKAIISIENVVASASINQIVDLNQITRSFADVKYHPDQFPGLVFRLKTPKIATLIFYAKSILPLAGIFVLV